jgi:hypothetical protein
MEDRRWKIEVRLSERCGEILRQAQDDSFPAPTFSPIKGFFDTLKLEVGLKECLVTYILI